MRETDSEIVDDLDAGVEAIDRLPVLQTILAGYRFVGEHFVSFALVTISLATVHFSLMRLSPLVNPLAHISIRTGLLHVAVAVASMVVSSVVFAIVGVGWYRRTLAGERRRSSWFGPRELQFAVAMVLFYFVLSVPGELSQTGWGRSAMHMAYRLEQSTGYPSDFFWPTIIFLWRVLATALLFFTFPAIALDIRQPLAHGIRTARRILPNLLLIYLIGLVPWFALDKFGIRALILEVDVERLVFAGMILNTWITACTFALAGAAYVEIVSRETSRRLSADFE
jgi:hypothetical protein